MATKKYLSLDRLTEYNDLIKAYADNAATTIKNELLNGAGEAYDTLKELGDLISENVNAIEALETVATGKADKDHNHDDMYYTETEMNSLLESKSDSDHNHDSSYDAKGSADTALSSAKTYTDEQIAAIPTPDVSGQIATHNEDPTAHTDIRDMLGEVQTRANDAYVLAESKQDKLTGAVDQVVSFDEQGNVITISAITIDEIDTICNGVSILSAEAVRY